MNLGGGGGYINLHNNNVIPLVVAIFSLSFMLSPVKSSLLDKEHR